MCFVSSLREAENEKWLFCFSGDFCQTGPCGARTGLCPGGAGPFPHLGCKLPAQALTGRRNPVLFRKEKTGTSYPRVSPGTSHGLFCHTGPTGGNQGACVVLWDGWLRKVPPVPEGTQGTQNSARGRLDRVCVTCWEFFQGCKKAMCKGVLLSFCTICRRFDFSKHKIGKCAPHPFALLHSSFFSQPIPLVGQANGLHIAS